MGSTRIIAQGPEPGQVARPPLSSRGAHSFLLSQVVGVRDDCCSAVFLIALLLLKQALSADLQPCLVSRQSQLPLTTAGRNPKSLPVGPLRMGWGFLSSPKGAEKVDPFSPFSNSGLLLMEAEGWGRRGRKAGTTSPQKSHRLCLVVSGIWGCSEPCVPALGL